MKKIIFLIFLSLFVVSCGDKKETTIENNQAKNNTGIVLSGTQIQTNSGGVLTNKEIKANSGNSLDDISDNFEDLGISEKISYNTNYFGGQITGKLKKNKAEKVIITPEKSDECELDLEPYELKDFKSGLEKFVYNFSLKLKNICPNGGKFNIQIIGIDGTKEELKQKVSGNFYDESYKNMFFVKEKNDLKKDENKEYCEGCYEYKGYFNINGKKKYLYSEGEFGLGEKGCYLSDKKVNIDYLLEIKEKDYSNILGLYFDVLKSGVKIDKNILTLDYNYYEEILNLEKYNSTYEKNKLFGQDIYYKNKTFFVKGKNDLMLLVNLKLNNTVKYNYKINKDEKNLIYLQVKNDVFNNYIAKIKDLNVEKLGKIEGKQVYTNKETGCLYIPIEGYEEFGLKYDYYSTNLKINFLDGKNYGDYTFRLAGQAGYDNYSDGAGDMCYFLVTPEDLEPEKRLVLAGDYVGYSIYKFKDKDDAYLKRRFREQFGVKRGEETGERYEEFVKTLPVLYWKDPFGRWIRVVNMKYVPQAEKMKPVIYLYPEKTQNINVKVEPNGGFSLTIPEYPKNGWDVISTSDSQITFEGKIYPYLFWEGKAIGYEMGKKGFVIKNNKIEIERFLNDKLAKLGLNSKEIYDFNEYWIEKLSLVKDPYIFITFASKEEQDFDSPLEITPKPDSIIRVFMDYKGLQKLEKVEELEIITPERKGFSVVEWGGAKRW